MNRREHTGFTLIELLVVIAIIAILAAILFPVFAKARERANTTACMSNMKQIGIGLYTYLSDYDECYPVLRRTAGSPGVTVDRTWREELSSYVKSINVFACPSNPDAKRFPKLTAEGSTVPISYALNGSLFGSLEGDISKFHVWNMRKIKEPSQSIFVTETRHRSAEVGGWLIGYDMDTTKHTGFFFHHSSRINMVMCDTSARSMKLLQTIVPTDYWHDARIPDSSAYAAAIQKEYQ
jgi:prepilin-type N-terminal cleavage/methylation domain-containing protein